jgi:hypothetical protein
MTLEPDAPGHSSTNGENEEHERAHSPNIGNSA